MKTHVPLLVLALAAPVALLARAPGNGGDTAVGTGPTAEQGTTAKLVYGLLSDSRYAYRPRALDDSLSADIFKRYLEALDRGK
jgi:carboxyl-terminal processing protease